MELLQQLFMTAFAAFVFSILMMKLVSVAINGNEEQANGKRKRICDMVMVEELKLKEQEGGFGSGRSKRKSKSKKKVRFAVDDELVAVHNMVKFEGESSEKVEVVEKSCDLEEVFVGGGGGIEEEVMMSKKVGSPVVELTEVGFSGVENQSEEENKESESLGVLEDSGASSIVDLGVVEEHHWNGKVDVKLVNDGVNVDDKAGVETVNGVGVDDEKAGMKPLKDGVIDDENAGTKSVSETVIDDGKAGVKSVNDDENAGKKLVNDGVIDDENAGMKSVNDGVIDDENAGTKSVNDAVIDDTKAGMECVDIGVIDNEKDENSKKAGMEFVDVDVTDDEKDKMELVNDAVNDDDKVGVELMTDGVIDVQMAADKVENAENQSIEFVTEQFREGATAYDVHCLCEDNAVSAEEDQICTKPVCEDSNEEVEKAEEVQVLGEEDDDWEGIERSELEKMFARAANFAKFDDHLQSLGSDELMQLYGLHKVATEGPCHEAQPMALKVSARAKWNAWQRLGNMSPDMAMERYISLLSEKVPGWSHRIKSFEVDSSDHNVMSRLDTSQESSEKGLKSSSDGGDLIGVSDSVDEDKQ